MASEQQTTVTLVELEDQFVKLSVERETTAMTKGDIELALMMFNNKYLKAHQDIWERYGSGDVGKEEWFKAKQRLRDESLAMRIDLKRWERRLLELKEQRITLNHQIQRAKDQKREMKNGE